jgi:hypothetical protein
VPGPVVNQASALSCSHGGAATPLAPNPRVMVAGAAVITVGSPYTIAGCALAASSGPFCASGAWTVGSTRVTVMGQPVAVSTGASVCAAPGTPFVPVAVQPRVVAT